MATNTIYIDTNLQCDNFLFIATKGSSPSLRAYIYTDETAISLTATNTCKFLYAVNRDASEVVEIEGVINIGTNYIDFNFEPSDINVNGKFFASILLYDSSDSTVEVLSDGYLILKKNPISNG